MQETPPPRSSAHPGPRQAPDPTGTGPLAEAEPDTGRPIDDPVLADHANPRWADPSSPRPDAQPLANPDGTPNVMPAGHADMPIPGPAELEGGTTQGQAARPIEGEIGRDTIRQGLGEGAANPALAEGGEGGDGS